MKSDSLLMIAVISGLVSTVLAMQCEPVIALLFTIGVLPKSIVLGLFIMFLAVAGPLLILEAVYYGILSFLVCHHKGAKGRCSFLALIDDFYHETVPHLK